MFLGRLLALSGIIMKGVVALLLLAVLVTVQAISFSGFFEPDWYMFRVSYYILHKNFVSIHLELYMNIYYIFILRTSVLLVYNHINSALLLNWDHVSSLPGVIKHANKETRSMRYLLARLSHRHCAGQL